MNPKDLSDLDPHFISFVTLKNGNMILLDDTAPLKKNMEKKKLNFKQAIETSHKIPLKISDNFTFSYDKDESMTNKFINNKYKNIQNNTNSYKLILKNDFNIVSHIEKNTNFSYLGKKNQYLINNIKNSSNIKDNIISRNNPLNRCKEDNGNLKHIINISEKTSNFNYSKSSNNFYSSKTNYNDLYNNKVKTSELTEDNNIINQNKNMNMNLNNNFYEENKEDNNNLRTSKKYKERMGKLIGNINKSSVNAVISLDIPSDVPFDISGIQKQFNMLITQLKRKKNRHKKFKEENYQRYYELYKNQNKKVYNGTFTHVNNRLKYFQEHLYCEKKILDGNDLYEKDSYFIKKNNIEDIIYKNYKSSKNLRKINYLTTEKINDYNKRNKPINYLFNDKSRASSDRINFRDKSNRSGFRYKSAIIYPSNKSNSKLSRKNILF